MFAQRNSPCWASHLYSSIAPKAYIEARESRHACRKPQPRQRAGLWWLRATSAIISTDSNSAMEAGAVKRSLLRHDLRRRC